MANPAGLDYKVPSPDFFDDYEVGGTFVPPPAAKELNERGRLQFKTFTAQLPGLDKFEIGATRDGYLKVVIKDIVVDGYTISQTHVGSKQYNKYDKNKNVTGTRNASPLGDLFRSAGIDLAAVRPATPEDYQNLINALADRQVAVTIDWSAYDKDAQSDIAEKFEDFPLEVPANGEGSARQPFIEKDGKRFWARASVKRWVSAV